MSDPAEMAGPNGRNPEIDRAAIALFEAMLDLPEDKRDAWIAEQTLGKPELRSRVEAMRAADRLESLRTGGAIDMLEDEAPAPERIGAYRIVAPIGRGGMGSVYRAERASGDFAHVVAIKIIKPGLLAASLIERFQRERQTLAQLSHPHIAQLYDGGELDGGAPYIVMEYVDGLPLLQWTDAHQADRARRQGLFLDICNAVAAAHRALVVHRDLTPSNVLVTRDGEVKLIDFGIAKLAETDSRDAGSASAGARSAQGLSLTPGYAAPERFTGAPVTTAADVYSLGRLLEKLIGADADDDEPRAIIDRATADDPAARYATVDALADDVRAWRDGRAVSAMGQDRSYRVRKFVSRHRTALAASGLALILLAAAFVRAESARADAERRFDETRAIAKTLLFDTYDEVSRAPGSTRARALLAEKGLAYLNSLAASATASNDVKLEAGLGYLRLAQVTGGGAASQMGKFEDANTLLGKADAILAPLHRADTDNPDARLALAQLRLEQSRVAVYNNNDAKKGREQAQETQALLKDWPEHNPVSAATLAEAIMAEGDAALWSEAFAQAEPILLRCESFIAGLPPALQNDQRVMRVRATNQRMLGEALHKQKRVEPARAAIGRGVAIVTKLSEQFPNDPAIKRQLASQLRYQANVHRANKRDAEARASIAGAVEAARWGRDRDPDDAGALQTFAVVAELNAMILADTGAYAQSYAISDEVISTLTRLVKVSGGAAGARRSLAAALITTGGNHYNGANYARACEVWSQARGIFRQLEAEKAVTESDGQVVAELDRYLKEACDPPRPGTSF